MYVYLGQSDIEYDLASARYGANYVIGWRIKKGLMKLSEIAPASFQSFADTVVGLISYRHGFQDAGFNKNLYPRDPDNLPWGNNTTLIKKASAILPLTLTKYKIEGGLPYPQLGPSIPLTVTLVPVPNSADVSQLQKSEWNTFLNTLPSLIPAYLQIRLRQRIQQGAPPPSKAELLQWQKESGDISITQQPWFLPVMAVTLILGGLFIFQRTKSYN